MGAVLAATAFFEDPAFAVDTFTAYSWSLMHICVTGCQQSLIRGDFLRIAQFLVSKGCPVDTKDIGGFTPLHLCCVQMCTPQMAELIRFLLGAGANSRNRTRRGFTPILNAVMRAPLAIDPLLRARATMFDEDADGSSAWLYATRSLQPHQSQQVWTIVDNYLKDRDPSRKTILGQRRAPGSANLALPQKLKSMLDQPERERYKLPTSDAICKLYRQQTSFFYTPNLSKEAKDAYFGHAAVRVVSWSED